MGSCDPYVKMVKTERVEHWKKPAVKSAAKKAPRYYPAEDVKGKLGNHHNTRKQTKLRKSISAGTVVIMLAGPYKLNGVPLRRVPQSYVIATTTQVDVSKVSIPADVNDDLFKKPKKANKKDEDGFYGDGKKENTLDESRKALQKTVDTAVLSSIAATPLLKQYLSAKFCLKKGQKPHEMTF